MIVGRDRVTAALRSRDSVGAGRVSGTLVACFTGVVWAVGGLGELGGVTNSGSTDESLVSSVKEGEFDLGVLAGETRGGVGEGEAVTEDTGEGEEMNARVGTATTTSAFEIMLTAGVRETERPRRSLVLTGATDRPVPAPVLATPVIGLRGWTPSESLSST